MAQLKCRARFSEDCEGVVQDDPKNKVYLDENSTIDFESRTVVCDSCLAMLEEEQEIDASRSA